MNQKEILNRLLYYYKLTRNNHFKKGYLEQIHYINNAGIIVLENEIVIKLMDNAFEGKIVMRFDIANYSITNKVLSHIVSIAKNL